MGTFQSPKNLTLRKLEAGGHEVLDERGQSLGVISHKHLMAHVRRYHEGFDQLSSVRLSEALPVDRRVIGRATEIMRETGASVAAAMRAVLRADDNLAREYTRAHQRDVSADVEPRPEVRGYRRFRGTERTL